MPKSPFIHVFTSLAFLFNTLGTSPLAYAQELRLPTAGSMVPVSPSSRPVLLKALKVYPKNPFRFDFILDKGDSVGTTGRPFLQTESEKLIKYFLASLTIP